MSDRRDDDFEFDDEWPVTAAGEGIRVVGPGASEPGYPEAGYPEAGYGEDPLADPYAPPVAAPPGRFALPEDVEPWPAEVGAWDEPAGPGTQPELQHWTEPATGEVPSVLGGGGAGSGDDFDSWSALPGPRFRVGESDWAEEDFAGGELRKDQSTSFGALADEHAAHDPHAAPEPAGRRGRSRGRGRGRGRGAAPETMPPEPGGLEGAPVSGAVEDYDDQGGASGSDLTSRVVTATVVAVVGLAAFAAGRPAAAFLVTIIVGACAFELYEAFRRSGYHTATVIGLLGCIAIVPVAYNQGERGIVMVSVLVIMFSFLWYLFEVVHARPTMNVSLTLLVFCWIGILGAFAGMLLAPDPGGTGLLLGVVACAVGADIAAYFAGRAFGSTPLMPRVSPSKTVEGLIGGTITAVLIGAVVGGVLHPWADKGIGAGIALGLVVAITAPIGDLVESLVKRDLGIKDIGAFLPGHGGFLDRFDAILFTLPAAYYLALQLFS